MQQYNCIRFLEDALEFSFTCSTNFQKGVKILLKSNLKIEGRSEVMTNLSIPKDSTIMAIYPVYTDEGDMTFILCNDGRELQLRSSVDSVMKKLAMRNNRNLNLVRSWMYRGADGTIVPGRHLGRTLGISPMLNMIPFKVRKPKISSDGSFGYVNYRYLRDVRPSHRHDEYITALILTGGHLLLSMWSIAAIDSRVIEAERIQHRFYLLGEELLADIRSRFDNAPYMPHDPGYEHRIPK